MTDHTVPVSERLTDTTCYVERSMVRIGVMGTGDEALLKYVDALPIFTAADFSGHAQTPQQWRPIETAPKDGTNILICGFDFSGRYFVADVKWVPEEGEFCLFSPHEDAHTVPTYQPSLWMPLPAPPALSQPSPEGSK